MKCCPGLLRFIGEPQYATGTKIFLRDDRFTDGLSFFSFSVRLVSFNVLECSLVPHEPNCRFGDNYIAINKDDDALQFV